MWSIFGKSKEQKQQERILKENKVANIKKEIKAIKEKASAIADDQRNENRKAEEKSNSVCPKCNGTNVNDRIKCQQGELNGSFSGSSWSALTFGSSESHGSIIGSLDTNEVNKCNDCQHEWKKHKHTYTYSGDIIKNRLRLVKWHLEDLSAIRNVKFDPEDIKEEYNSLEEKKTAMQNKLKNSWKKDGIKEFWSGTSLEALRYFIKEHEAYQWDNIFDEKELISLGFKSN